MPSSGRLCAHVSATPSSDVVCLVSVGGSGVGTHLLHRVAASYDEARRRIPNLRMVVVTGPRIDPA